MLGPLAASDPGPQELAAGASLEVDTGPLAVDWASIVNCVVTPPNTLTKTSGGGWDAGAVSSLACNSGDCYVECGADSGVMFGLSLGNSGQGYADVDFALSTGYLNYLYVYEKGVSRGSVGTFVGGDILRVAVEGGSVVYRKNGGLLYTSLLSPTFPLLLDTSIRDVGRTISGATIYAANGLIPSGY